MSGKTTQGLDLDTLEAEDGEIREPYEFTLGGRQWTANDPDLVDWRDIAAIDDDDLDDPRVVLKVYLSAETYAEFAQVDGVPKWKVRRLLRALAEHYTGVRPGESGGSPTS